MYLFVHVSSSVQNIGKLDYILQNSKFNILITFPAVTAGNSTTSVLCYTMQLTMEWPNRKKGISPYVALSISMC